MINDFLNLTDRRIVIFGMANRKSVAAHVGQVLTEAGAKVIHVVRSEQRREQIRKLVGDVPIHVCDVEHQDQIDRVRDEIATQHGPIQGFVHSLAFADYSAGWLPFHETPRPGVPASGGRVVLLVHRAWRTPFEDYSTRNGSVVTVSISTTRMAAENYGYMAPVKAALDSSVCFLAKSFAKFSSIRFNAVCPGLLKTSASAGIPGYVDSYLHAEKATLRKRAVQTDEVANAVAFLLSPRSSGINAQGLVIDAGMSINYFDDSLVRPT